MADSGRNCWEGWDRMSRRVIERCCMVELEENEYGGFRIGK